ncbi:hypothetical protein MPSEU_000492300 [Mayamaea pseudoterrestris]|nr:hypothetical protein MPSEU_000492300 [Mayamaea pseudoterrestris]
MMAMFDDASDDELRLLTITSEAMEGEMVCGMEVEIADSKDSGGGTSDPTVSHSNSWSLSSSENYNNVYTHRKSTVNSRKYMYSGPFLPDTCEIDDVADGRCSPVYNFKRKASRSRQVMHLQLTSTTLSINSLTDLSECPSCPSDERSPVSVQPLDALLDDLDRDSDFSSHITTSLKEVTETDERADFLSTNNCSSELGPVEAPAGEIVTPEAREIAGPPLPPQSQLVTTPFINVVDPSPDLQFSGMIERTLLSLRSITLKKSDISSSAFAPRQVSLCRSFHERQTASLMPPENYDLSDCYISPLQYSRSAPLTIVFHASGTGKKLSLRDMDPCHTDLYHFILHTFRLSGEVAKLTSQMNAWATGMICSEPEIMHDATQAPASLDDATAILINDEELRKLMTETKGGRDLSMLVSCLSIDTTATKDTDDGLEDELQALDMIEDDLRKQLQDVDLIVKGVYIQDIKMKSESSESLFRTSEKKKTDTRRSSRQRRVSFSKKNTQYVFGTQQADVDANTEEGIGDLILTTCEDLYGVLEEMSEEIGYACLATYRRTKKQCIKPLKPGNRPIKRSTIHFCA